MDIQNDRLTKIHTHRQRQTDRQTDRRTNILTYRTDKQTNIDKQTDKQTNIDKQTDKLTYIQDRQAGNRQTGMQAGHTDKLTYIQERDRQAGSRQTDKHPGRHTDKQRQTDEHAD